MSAFDELIASLVTGGMEPAHAAALVARAVIEAIAKQKTSGAARQARYRERHKASQSVTEASPCSAVTVTSQASQSVTSNGSTAEGVPLSDLASFESPAEFKEEKSTDVLSTEPRARVKRGARLPDDWQPSEADRQLAAGRGLRPADIEIEATKFRNYWTNRTDRQASKPRWDRAWENWILNVRGKSNGRSVVDAQDRLNAKIAEFSEPDMLSGVRGEEGASHVRMLPTRRSG